MACDRDFSWEEEYRPALPLLSNRDPRFDRVLIGVDATIRCIEEAGGGQRLDIRVSGARSPR
jgi:hypothetical protein